MERVGAIEKVQACVFDLLVSKPLKIGAIARVSTGGYSEMRLDPRAYIVPPSDGLWDFDFVASPPSGLVIQVESRIAGSFDGEAPDWLRGVRVHGIHNAVEGAIYSVLSD